ncbi:MAG: ribbon-helix-helix domain-containing protein [Acetobacteraceae bacterium]
MPNSITLAADLDDALSRLAATTGRSKSVLVHEALRSFVATEGQFLAAVEEGKQALKEGRVVDHAAVVAAFDRIITPGC